MSACAAGETPSVKAYGCAVAAGNEASSNTLNCYIGLTPEQLRGLTNLAIGVAPAPAANLGEVIANLCAVAAKGDAKNNMLNCHVGPDVLVGQIKEISGKLEITEQAALTLLGIVGKDSSIPEDKLADALIKVAQDYKRLKAQVAALTPDNATALTLVEQAKPEIDAGHFARARELLRQATGVQLAGAREAHKLREKAQAAEDAQMLGAASSTAAEGDLALTERDYTQAADLFGQAANYVPSGHASEQGDYLRRQADALYRQGDERGDNEALEGAIETYRRAVADYPRSWIPLGGRRCSAISEMRSLRLESGRGDGAA